MVVVGQHKKNLQILYFRVISGHTSKQELRDNPELDNNVIVLLVKMVTH